jgi:hypothetical protein
MSIIMKSSALRRPRGRSGWTSMENVGKMLNDADSGRGAGFYRYFNKFDPIFDD